MSRVEIIILALLIVILLASAAIVSKERIRNSATISEEIEWYTGIKLGR